MLASDNVLVILGTVMASELDLKKGKLMVSYEKWDIPENYKGLYIALWDLGGPFIANNNEFDPEKNLEIQTATKLHVVQVDLLSFNDDAVNRQAEVIMALASMAAQRAADKYSIKIATIPESFITAPTQEPTSFLKRYTARLQVTQGHIKTKAADYYDQNPREVKFNV